MISFGGADAAVQLTNIYLSGYIPTYLGTYLTTYLATDLSIIQVAFLPPDRFEPLCHLWRLKVPRLRCFHWVDPSHGAFVTASYLGR